MTDLSDLLRPEAVVTDMGAGNKKTLFAQMAALVAPQVELDPRLVADRVTDRERLGSTGFGYGVGIPHARIDGLKQITGAFARLAQPIEYQAVDDLPVDLVFLLLSPADAGAEHLKALARVSRLLRDARFLAKLRGAGSRDALYALFTTDEARDAA
ncbi:PTS sugar transporter subunit IIA [Sphingomonas lenta]|uniref:PTS lactose transporter subunit IIC n=1 Tax=Sphingomonas lenta TaxID=1141887 RepID=A0A2A2SE82_9SPHN|nr:PTS sugar transporter subunit IIA [Sphingomonas lenta]PAX07505.1 PTS lactose transporter subunit IIC [Sphingomonas lenta]